MPLFGPPNIEKMKEKKNVKGLIKALKHKDSDIRKGAADALGEIGDARVVKPLIKALQDSDMFVYLKAAEALGKIGDARAVESLIVSLQNRSKYGVEEALEALGKIGTPAVEPLIAALQDSNKDIRRYAADALGKIGDARAVESLIKALQDSEMFVSSKAAEALGKIGAPAVEPLIAALQDSDKDVRQYAAGILGKIGDARAVESLINALQDSNGRVRRKAVLSLGEIGDARAVEPLINTLQDSYNDVRQNTANVLGKIGDTRAVEPLIATLQDSNEYVRENAANALGKIGDTRAVEPLINALQDFHVVRKQAGKALDEIGWKPGKDKLSAKYWIAKRNWSKCIEIGAPAVEPLIAAFQDRFKENHRKAVEALGKIGDAQAVEPLINALQDSDYEVRRKAAEALGKIGDTRAVEPLINTLQDSNESVRQEAVEALGKLGWQPGTDEQTAWYWIAKQDWEQCAALGTPAVEPLLAVLQASVYRSWYDDVLTTLGEIGDERAVEPLAAVLESEHDSHREAAVRALTKMGHAQRVEEAGYIFTVPKMEMVHYALVRFSNKQLRRILEKAKAEGGMTIEVPLGDLKELTDGVSILVDRMKDSEMQPIEPPLLDWAIRVTDVMDRATDADENPHRQLKLWQEAYAMCPDYPLILMSLGVSYAKCGEVESAIEFLEKAHRAAPENDRIRNNLEGIKRDLL